LSVCVPPHELAAWFGQKRRKISRKLQISQEIENKKPAIASRPQEINNSARIHAITSHPRRLFARQAVNAWVGTAIASTTTDINLYYSPLRYTISSSSHKNLTTRGHCHHHHNTLFVCSAPCWTVRSAARQRTC
jgi:hypothetical protein